MLAEKITKKLWAASPDDWGPIIAAELEPVRKGLREIQRTQDTLVARSVADVLLALIDGEDQ